MKKINLLIYLSIFSLNYCFGQIMEITEEENSTLLIGEAKNAYYCMASITKKDDSFYMTICDVRSDDLITFHLTDDADELDYLYYQIASSFSNKKDRLYQLKSGKLKVRFWATTELELIYINQYNISYSSPNIVRKRFAQLFNKVFNKADFR